MEADDIYLEIFTKCTPYTTLVCSFVNKQFYNIAHKMLTKFFKENMVEYNKKLIKLLYTTKEEKDKFEWELHFEGRFNYKTNKYNKHEQQIYNDDIILSILLQCDPQTLFKAASVCHQFHRISNFPQICKNLIAEHSDIKASGILYKKLYHTNPKKIYLRYHELFIKTNLKYTINQDHAKLYFNNFVANNEIKLKQLLTHIYKMLFPRMFFNGFKHNYYDKPIIIFYGSGNNGKTHLTGLIEKLLGSRKFFYVNNQTLNWIQTIPLTKQTELVVVDEDGHTTVFKNIDQYINGDAVNISKQFIEEITFKPQCRFLYHMNNISFIIRDSMINKIEQIKFTQTFPNPNINNVIPYDIENQYLNEVLSLIIDNKY